MPPGSPPVELPHRPVEKFVLNNGLTVIVREDPSAPIVSMQGWCETGSIHEGSWMGAGLSHILEHMLFKGTQSRGPEEVAREVGAAGGQINAYTSFDRTVYYIDCPGESSDACLDVLMDVVARASIPADEFASEQEVIRREFAMLDDDPDRVASQLMFSTAFTEHPYGVPVIGHREVFDQLSREDVLAYYHERYAPNNLFFVIVGDIDATTVRRQMEEFFSGMPRRRLAPCNVPPEPEQLGRRDAVRLFSTPVSKLWLAWRVPGITHPDMPALDVLAAILGEGRSSRLHRNVREERGSVHAIAAYSFTPAAGGLFAVGADLEPSRREEAERDILEQISRLLESGVEETELAKARRMALAAQFGSLVTAQGQASDLGANWLQTRNLEFTREYLRRLGEVDGSQLIEVAGRHLVDSGLNAIEVGPEERRSGAARKTRWVPRETEVFEFANGLQLAVRPDPRLPLVSVCAAFGAGLMAESQSNSGITALTAGSLMQGTQQRSAAELAELIESCGGTADAGSGNNSLYLSSGVMTPEFDIALELLSEVISAPAFPDDAVAREREAQLAAIGEEDQRPLSVALAIAKRELFGEHPYSRRRIGEAESVAELSPAQLRSFQAEFLCAKNGTMAICGDVEPSAARDAVERFFAGLPAGEERCADPPVPQWPDADRTAKAQRDKEQAAVVVALPGIELGSADRAAIDVITEALSGMDGRLFSRIREELGLAYFTGATQLVGRARGALLLYAGTRVDAAQQVEDEILKELARLAAGGLEADELSRAQRSCEGKHRLEMQSHGSRAQASALGMLYGLGENHEEQLLAEIGALDATAVAEVAQRYFATAPKICVQVTP